MAGRYVLLSGVLRRNCDCYLNKIPKSNIFLSCRSRDLGKLLAKC